MNKLFIPQNSPIRSIYWLYCFLRKHNIYVSNCTYTGPSGGIFYDKFNWKNGKIPHFLSRINNDHNNNLPAFPPKLFMELDVIETDLIANIHFPNPGTFIHTITVRSFNACGKHLDTFYSSKPHYITCTGDFNQ